MVYNSAWNEDKKPHIPTTMSGFNMIKIAPIF